MIPYQLNFHNIHEIRMGSPFNKASVSLHGSYVPNLEDYEFQDVGLVFGNGRFCALAQWDTTDNEPRFKVWLLDQKNNLTSISQSISGACTSIVEINGKLLIKYWHYDPHTKTGHNEELELQFA
ncbi:hypothetical protein [Bdellovibrio sp.]|uniref:hypothetical protein n=1 Tax=Bdellovibrio sp. TaxID=28201 RepID=UPI0039E64437